MRVEAVLVLAASIGSASPAHCEPRHIPKISDRLTDRTVTWASKPAKADANGVTASLEIGCTAKQHSYAIALSKPLYGSRVPGRYRIDNGREELRTGFNVFSDRTRVHIIESPPFSLAGRRRFRIELLIGGQAYFYEFDLDGIGAALKAVRC